MDYIYGEVRSGALATTLLLHHEDATPVPNGFLPLVHTNDYVASLYEYLPLHRYTHFTRNRAVPLDVWLAWTLENHKWVP